MVCLIGVLRKRFLKSRWHEIEADDVYYWSMPFSSCYISNSNKHIKEHPWEYTISWAELSQKLKLFASVSCLAFHKMLFLLCVNNGIGWGNANWVIKSLFDEVIEKGPVVGLQFLLHHGGLCLLSLPRYEWY